MSHKTAIKSQPSLYRCTIYFYVFAIKDLFTLQSSVVQRGKLNFCIEGICSFHTKFPLSLTFRKCFAKHNVILNHRGLQMLEWELLQFNRKQTLHSLRSKPTLIPRLLWIGLSTCWLYPERHFQWHLAYAKGFPDIVPFGFGCCHPWKESLFSPSLMITELLTGFQVLTVHLVLLSCRIRPL